MIMMMQASQVPPRKSTSSLLVRLFVAVTIAVCSLLGLYHLVASPPLHLAFDAAPAAGPNSVYVPGSGFSGFWYHLGLLQSSPDLHNHDYYCYSSGCLSLVLAFWNTTLDDTFDASFQLQQAWLDGNITRYDLVNGFLDHFLSASTLDHMSILSRLHILVTTASTGVHIEAATSLAELRDLLIKTTWIPYVTGEGVLQQTQDYYLDGGFSRSLHPVCEQTLTVPLTWKTGVYTLDPSFEKSTAAEFWSMGQQARSSTVARMAVF